MKRLIIADDDPGIQDALRLVFSHTSYKVTIYSDGNLLMKNHFYRPDAFILDKQLSGMDGLDICRFLKGQAYTKNIPVIMISANPDIDQLSKEAGADAYLEKPFDTAHLLEIVDRYTR